MMKRLFIALALVLLFSCNKVDTPATGGGGQFPGETEHPDEVDKPRPEHKGRVVTSPDGRYLMYENGQPFFWLADTAWLLTDRMNIDEAEEYLVKRAEQGYTVIMFSCLGDDYATYNANYIGDKAFKDADYTIFNPKYFEHVRNIIDIADRLGLVVGFLPNWGDKLCRLWGYETPVLHTKERAENYGRYIGILLKDKENVVYILGGDRPASGQANGTSFDIRALIRAQAKGIAIGISGKEDYSKCTMTYHPSGYQTSSTWFAEDEWLDFNMQQNGHGYDDVWERIHRDYVKTPVKPVVDGEPTYDEHWLNFKEENGMTSDLHCRRYFYHEVFSGAFGHTYGTTGIWSFYDPTIPFKSKKEDVRTSSWRESLELPSGIQMVYGKNLMMSRPYFSRIPDNTIVLDLYSGHKRISATTDKNKTYAMAYTEQGAPIKINMMSVGKGKTVNAWWFNPRTGKSVLIGNVEKTPSRVFTPATNGPGNDWVLVIDDPEAGYSAPGKEICKENQ